MIIKVHNLIHEEPENNYCVDCDDKIIDHWASLNNAVFVCINCSGIHRGFDLLIQMLGILKRNEDQVQRFQLGGNRRFKEFMKQYNLDNSSIHTKYKTKAAQFYRDNLDNVVKGNPQEKQPSIEEGQQLLQQAKKDIDQYFAFGSDDIVKQERPKKYDKKKIFR